MKKLLIGTVMIMAAMNAFSSERRIDCMSENKRVQVSLIGINDEFTKIENLKVLKLGWYGVSYEVKNPNCKIFLRGSVHNVFAIINCEEHGLIVNQFIRENGFGDANIEIGLKRHVLNCENNF